MSERTQDNHEKSRIDALERRIETLEAENEKLKEQTSGGLLGSKTRRQVLGAMVGGGTLLGASGTASAFGDDHNSNAINYVGENAEYQYVQNAVDNLAVDNTEYNGEPPVRAGKVVIEGDYAVPDSFPIKLGTNDWEGGNIVIQGHGPGATRISGENPIFEINPTDDAATTQVTIRDLQVEYSPNVARVMGGTNHYFENIRFIKSSGGRAFKYDVNEGNDNKDSQSFSATFSHVDTHDAGLINANVDDGGNNAMRFFGCDVTYPSAVPLRFNSGDSDISLFGCTLQLVRDSHYHVLLDDIQSFKMYGGYTEFKNDQSSYPDGQWLVGSLDNGDNSTGNNGSMILVDGVWANGGTGYVRAMDDDDRVVVRNCEYTGGMESLVNIQDARNVFVEQSSCWSSGDSSADEPIYSGDSSVVRGDGARFVPQDLSASGAAEGRDHGDLAFHTGSSPPVPAYWDANVPGWRRMDDNNLL